MNAAVANAVFNATGKRVRALPIRSEKLLQLSSGPLEGASVTISIGITRNEQLKAYSSYESLPCWFRLTA